MSFEGVSGWCHVALRQLLRLSDGLAKRSFCCSHILRVQLKSNSTVGEWLLASDQSQFDNAGLSYLSENGIFLNACFKNLLICKIFSAKESSASTHGSQGTAQTVRWPCEPIILSIGHFEGQTEVKLSSWWRTVSLWSITVWWCRLIALKRKWNIFKWLIQKFIHLWKIFFERLS